MKAYLGAELYFHAFLNSLYKKKPNYYLLLLSGTVKLILQEKTNGFFKYLSYKYVFQNKNEYK
jgi:hypothetical protein